MNDAYIDFLDFSLKKLNEVYPNGKQISTLASEYKHETGILINNKEQIHFLELYNYKHLCQLGTSWVYKISPETKKIVDRYGSYSAYIKELATESLKNENEDNEFKKLQIENLNLQNQLISLQTKQQRRYILYSIISFTLGLLAAYLKEILQLFIQ
ncbi:MAG: hypothetical protein HXX18_04595 [Bacteroidetes bacterium]|nr:hypothetical protein [Bacteroidota bacterium]